MRLGVAPVHLEQVGGKDGGLVATGPLPDLDDHVFLVVGVLWDQRNLESRLQPIPLGLLAFEFLSRVGLHLRIAFKLGQLFRLRHAPVGAAVRLV